jgi:hypothetical protein
MKQRSSIRAAIPLRNRVTCPHCWNIFPPEQALWIAQHPDLIGDPRLGDEQQQRFLPTRFTVDGAALDARGFACHELACPRCHLAVPRLLFETEPLFLSILGAPACGKSYFLTSMTWQMRKVLPKNFSLAFGDADPLSNHRLHGYEELQFLNPDQDALVAIEKTETQGDLYDTVLYADQAVSYPRPFLFSIQPLKNHPNYQRFSRILCLYDNAGESFLPGEDTAIKPYTRHLALSRALMFLFDPTQDRRFRSACAGKSADPQMQSRTQRLARERAVRQETILLEAAARVRRYAGLPQNAKHHRPLVIVATKYDSWSTLLGPPRLDTPWITTRCGICALRLSLIEQISKEVRGLLWEHTPELVSAAESFAEEVVYIPVSATGCGPEVDPASGAFGFRPRNINPMWAEVPALYVMAKWMEGIVPIPRPTESAPSAVAFTSPAVSTWSINMSLKSAGIPHGDGHAPDRKPITSSPERLP